jgi:hypothetical protein
VAEGPPVWELSGRRCRLDSVAERSRPLRAARARSREFFERIANWIDHRLRPNSLKRRFTSVYDQGGWSDPVLGAPQSGLGSTVKNTTGSREVILTTAIRLFSGQATLRIVDAPCGDMTWMPLLLNELAKEFEHVEYTGIDVVEDLIESNRKRVCSTSNVSCKFECLDVTRDRIPDCDLFFCKDLVNHLNNRDISRLIKNLQNSNCKYAMISSNTGCENSELPDGDYASRPVDLEAPPFSLPEPIQGNRYLVFWKLPFRST